MGEKQPPLDSNEVMAWAKRWKPQWEIRITFPQNIFFNELCELLNQSDDLDATIYDGKHRLQLRLEHAYDPDSFYYRIKLPDMNAIIDLVPFKPDYGPVMRKRYFMKRAKAFDRFAQEVVRRIPIDQQGPQIRTIEEVMQSLNFSPEVIEITQETLFGNPDPIKYRYLKNPVSFINLQNGWIVVPSSETALRLNLGVEYEHVFRLSYRFDKKEGPVVENYQKYKTALNRLSRQTIRRVFSNLGEYTAIIHNPFFSDISQRFPVRFVALNNGLLVASLGTGSGWEKGTFEFYQPTQRREMLFGLIESD